MNKSKKIILFTVPVLLGIFSGCTNSTENTSSSESGVQETTATTISTEEQTAMEAVIVLKDGDEEITSKEVNFEEDQTLMDIMKENFEIEESDGMITAIDGHKQNESESKYWVYTVNDEQVNEGATTKVLSPDDQVVFTLEKF